MISHVKLKLSLSPFSFFSLKLPTTYVSQKANAERGHQALKPSLLVLTSVSVAAMQVSRAAA